MKYCPICGERYDDQVEVCKADGATLKISAPKRDPYIGNLIKGRYRVIQKLGEGGMGTVYLAEQVSVGRKVALKVLKGNYATDEEFIGRFRREARLAASLNHPYIVTVYDFDQCEDGNLFIAMEYVDGVSLSQLIRRDGSLAVDRAIRLGVQIAEGLERAHRAGVIHRDIKPENIMIVGHGTEEKVKLMDFGIARLRDTKSGSQLTRSGMVMGTPAYMAPEQVEGSDITERTDIYALGIVLYEMLSGHVPFTAPTPHAVLLKHLQEKPLPLRKLRREIPASLERAVMQALEKNPENRQYDMREMARTLQKAAVVLPPERFSQTISEIVHTMPETIKLPRISRGSEMLRKPLVWGGGVAIIVVAAGLWVVIYIAHNVPSSSSTPAAQERSSTARLSPEGELEQINNHISNADAYRDRGDYLSALAELARARAIDPSNKVVQAEIARTKSACLAEQEAGMLNVICD